MSTLNKMDEEHLSVVRKKAQTLSLERDINNNELTDSKASEDTSQARGHEEVKNSEKHVESDLNSQMSASKRSTEQETPKKDAFHHIHESSHSTKPEIITAPTKGKPNIPLSPKGSGPKNQGNSAPETTKVNKPILQTNPPQPKTAIPMKPSSKLPLTPILKKTPAPLSALTAAATAISLPKSLRGGGGGSIGRVAFGSKKSPTARPKSRSKSKMSNSDPSKKDEPATKSHSKHSLRAVEVLGRKVTPLRDKSPYGFKIIEIPPDQQQDQTNKVFVGKRELKLLTDQVKGHEKEKKHRTEDEVKIVNWLDANPLYKDQGKKHVTIVTKDQTAHNHQKQHQTQQMPISKPTLINQQKMMPLRAWPNFENLLKVVETQTATEKQLAVGCETTKSVDFTRNIIDPSWKGVAHIPTTTDADGPKTKSEEGDGYEEDIDESLSSTLEKMADKVEGGIFTASETCNVLINTIFKEALGNPASSERVLESQDFQDFIHSPNEIEALEKSSMIFSTCSQLINEYLNVVKSSQLEFPSNTNFSRKTSGVVSVTTSRKNVTLAAQLQKVNSETKIWSFVPPTSPEKFQLALFFNPETGEIMQTVTCKEHIFRTRYTTSPLEAQIRSILSSNREQVGLPAFIKPHSLLDTIVRCASHADSRLSRSKLQIGKCSKSLYSYMGEITKGKYTVGTTKFKQLDSLRFKLQQMNIFAGIMYQISTEMHNACKNIQSGLWNSMHFQDVLKFTQIPNPLLNKKDQSQLSHVPIQDAMKELANGIRSIDYSIRLGQFSLETIRFGVKLDKTQKLLLNEYLNGIQILGSEKNVDYGSLLMTLLCSTEMINHFEDIIPSVDKFVRAAILTHLGQINWGTAELLGLVKRMQTDARILGMRTTFKLRELRSRFKREYGEHY